MYDSSLRDRAGLVIAQVEETMKRKLEDIPEVDQPQNVDVFLKITKSYGHWFDYYMVDLVKRALFWLEDYNATWHADSVESRMNRNSVSTFTSISYDGVVDYLNRLLLQVRILETHRTLPASQRDDGRTTR